MTDYLESTRKKNWNNKTSEAELIANNDGLKAAWDELERVKTLIAEDHVKAAAEITERHKEALDEAMTNYSLLLSLSR